ncbi:hypothetical protein MNEG_16421, partial [Monoraphidium neglectum]
TVHKAQAAAAQGASGLRAAAACPPKPVEAMCTSPSQRGCAGGRVQPPLQATADLAATASQGAAAKSVGSFTATAH